MVNRAYFVKSTPLAILIQTAAHCGGYTVSLACSQFLVRKLCPGGHGKHKYPHFKKSQEFALGRGVTFNILKIKVTGM